MRVSDDKLWGYNKYTPFGLKEYRDTRTPLQGYAAVMGGQFWGYHIVPSHTLQIASLYAVTTNTGGTHFVKQGTWTYFSGTGKTQAYGTWLVSLYKQPL